MVSETWLLAETFSFLFVMSAAMLFATWSNFLSGGSWAFLVPGWFLFSSSLSGLVSSVLVCSSSSGTTVTVTSAPDIVPCSWAILATSLSGSGSGLLSASSLPFISFCFDWISSTQHSSAASVFLLAKFWVSAVLVAISTTTLLPFLKCCDDHRALVCGIDTQSSTHWSLRNVKPQSLQLWIQTHSSTISEPTQSQIALIFRTSCSNQPCSENQNDSNKK